MATPLGEEADEGEVESPRSSVSRGSWSSPDQPEIDDAKALVLEEGGYHTYSGDTVTTDVFTELRLRSEAIEEIEASWEKLIQAVHGREQVGAAIYTTMVEALPAISGLFKTPKVVMQMRYMHGFRLLVQHLPTPAELKVFVETLAFQHLEFDVTVQYLMTFTTAILDLFNTELGDAFTSLAHESWSILLNYVGGAFIYVRREFSEHIKVLNESWFVVNTAEGKSGSVRDESSNKDKSNVSPDCTCVKSPNGKCKDIGLSEQQVPRTFTEMFAFNATVMGFGANMWMREVLFSFNDIVTHVADCTRMQEECEALALKLRHVGGKAFKIDLREFKAVMLASLRSLLPRRWDSKHENAWSWLWDNVERIASSSMQKVNLFASNLADFNGRLTPELKEKFADGIYANFFERCPEGQEYFKQSSTRLRNIAVKIIALVGDFYTDPDRVIEELSVLGLKHVGYGVSMELFPPFVDASVEMMKTMAVEHGKVGIDLEPTLCPVDRSHYLPANEMPAHVAMEGFRWCIGLVAKTLVRTTREGSNLVMAAIGANNAKKLVTAARTLPRGHRAKSMLQIQVGAHTISPLMVAIDTGSLEAAKAILVDLLTFRADRDHYYHGAEELFQRHPDIVSKLCQHSPSLLTTLLDGLVWRANHVHNGMRRVNLYIKYLVVGVDGEFSQALTSLIQHSDPVLITHQVVLEALWQVWSRVGARQFLFRKTWLLLTIVIYAIAQTVLEREGVGHRFEDWEPSELFKDPLVTLLMLCRFFIYVFTFGTLIYRHVRACISCTKKRDFYRFAGCVTIPGYLCRNRMEMVSLLLAPCLVVMLSVEPMIHCIFWSNCHMGDTEHELYHFASAFGMLLHYFQVLDLAVLSLPIAAFRLACSRIFGQVILWIGCIASLVLVFSSAVLALEQEHSDYNTWLSASRSLMLISFGLHEQSMMELEDCPLMWFFVVAFIVLAWICSVNMLVAQFTTIYMSMFDNLRGYAILERGDVLLHLVPSLPAKRWQRFVRYMRFEEPLEFGDGDIGLPGGVQLLEPGSLHPMAKEQIRRFGGKPDAALPFPVKAADLEEADESLQLERMIRRTVQKTIRETLGGLESQMNNSGTKRSHASSLSSADRYY